VIAIGFVQFDLVDVGHQLANVLTNMFDDRCRERVTAADQQIMFEWSDAVHEYRLFRRATHRESMIAHDATRRPAQRRSVDSVTQCSIGNSSNLVQLLSVDVPKRIGRARKDVHSHCCSLTLQRVQSCQMFVRELPIHCNEQRHETRKATHLDETHWTRTALATTVGQWKMKANVSRISNAFDVNEMLSKDDNRRLIFSVSQLPSFSFSFSFSFSCVYLCLGLMTNVVAVRIFSPAHILSHQFDSLVTGSSSV
jgi:hypothetical protein